MNLAIDIALWTIVVALGLTLFLRDQPMFADSLRFARREFFALLPRIAIDRRGRRGPLALDLTWRRPATDKDKLPDRE